MLYMQVYIYLSNSNVSVYLQERIRAGKELLATKRLAEENERKRCVPSLKLCYFIKIPCAYLAENPHFRFLHFAHVSALKHNGRPKKKKREGHGREFVKNCSRTWYYQYFLVKFSWYLSKQYYSDDQMCVAASFSKLLRYYTTANAVICTLKRSVMLL